MENTAQHSKASLTDIEELEMMANNKKLEKIKENLKNRRAILISQNRTRANLLRKKYDSLLARNSETRTKAAKIKFGLLSDFFKLPESINIYREFQLDTLKHGFRLARYQLKEHENSRNVLRIFNLKYPEHKRHTTNQAAIKKYVRWFEWMKQCQRSKK